MLKFDIEIPGSIFFDPLNSIKKECGFNQILRVFSFQLLPLLKNQEQPCQTINLPNVEKTESESGSRMHKIVHYFILKHFYLYILI